MIDTILWVVVGMIIGWNFPQPFWAKAVQDKVTAWWKSRSE